jgi:hypothetical protein
MIARANLSNYRLFNLVWVEFPAACGELSFRRTPDRGPGQAPESRSQTGCRIKACAGLDPVSGMTLKLDTPLLAAGWFIFSVFSFL